MMNKPLFSILIAQYNNGQYFEDCYNSIIAQTYSNWEVIIVDDASTDNSLEIIKQIIGNDERFKIYQNVANKGCGYTKRRAAELANGEVCAFLDPDDAITEDALQVMMNEHRNNPEVSAIYSQLYYCDEKLVKGPIRPSKQIENNNPMNFEMEGYVLHFLSYKKKLYDQTEGIDPYLQRAVDKDLVLKLYEVGPLKFISTVLHMYRVHEKGISNHQNTDKAYFWFWVTIINAAKRRNVNIEKLFLEKALTSRRQLALEKEIGIYNRSLIFKLLRKIGLFKI